jgi:hypothetical protein
LHIATLPFVLAPVQFASGEASAAATPPEAPPHHHHEGAAMDMSGQRLAP